MFQRDDWVVCVNNECYDDGRLVVGMMYRVSEPERVVESSKKYNIVEIEDWTGVKHHVHYTATRFKLIRKAGRFMKGDVVLTAHTHTLGSAWFGYHKCDLRKDILLYPDHPGISVMIKQFGVKYVRGIASEIYDATDKLIAVGRLPVSDRWGVDPTAKDPIPPIDGSQIDPNAAMIKADGPPDPDPPADPEQGLFIDLDGEISRAISVTVDAADHGGFPYQINEDCTRFIKK